MVQNRMESVALEVTSAVFQFIPDRLKIRHLLPVDFSHECSNGTIIYFKRVELKRVFGRQSLQLLIVY
jgi:hypothetical protein